MNTTYKEKSSGPHDYRKVLPPTTQTPGSRAVGSHGSGPQGRTGATQGRGQFSGAPPTIGGGCDWGSPHKTKRVPSTGRGA
jgi:hypothetical protein